MTTFTNFEQPVATQETGVTPEMRDFSRKRDPKFNINHADGSPDVYHGVPGLPALLLVEFATLMEQVEDSETTKMDPELFIKIVQLILAEEDSERFIARMRDKRDPIELPQLMDTMGYLMEEYGMRPTQQSERSSSGSDSLVAGTSSTETVQLPESTFAPSPVHAS